MRKYFDTTKNSILMIRVFQLIIFSPLLLLNQLKETNLILIALVLLNLNQIY